MTHNKKKIISVVVGIAVVLALVGTVAAINGWFGGGAAILHPVK